VTRLDGQAEQHLEADVAVIGYGPVGRLLSLLLGERGKRVVVVERQPHAYPLPRAVHFDDEIGRILQSVGVPPGSVPKVVGPYDDFYEWRAADRQPLLRLDWRGLGPSGWHVSNFFYQPALESILDAKVQALETVQVLRGWKAVTHLEDGGIRHLDARQRHLRPRRPPRPRLRWVLGSDHPRQRREPPIVRAAACHPLQRIDPRRERRIR
jgi:2-polyprenyl-6-methoxyphenol hydroxylase-like FAD-dependent oxidoreductase